MDGVASPKGRVMIMTTNAGNEIDKALLLDGRINMRIYLGNVGVELARSMFLAMYQRETSDLIIKDENDFNGTKFNPGSKTCCSVDYAVETDILSLAQQFAQQIQNDQISPAKLQGYFLKQINDPKAAVANIGGLLKEANP